MTTPATPVAMDTEDIGMEELNVSPAPPPEPSDTEWFPLLEDLF